MPKGIYKRKVDTKLINKKFNNLTVINFSHSKNWGTYWKCKCDCGNIIIVNRYRLENNIRKDCGCLRKSANKVRPGTITVRKTKKIPRRWIKIAEPSKWILYAKYIYIQHNGNIPNGGIIHHIDGDTLNDNINNLKLVTRKEHCITHNLHKLGNVAVSKKIWKKNKYALVVVKN
jgi:hypothetical protein